MDSQGTLVAYSPLATAWWHYEDAARSPEWVEEYRPIAGLGVTSVWRDHELCVAIVEQGRGGELRPLRTVEYVGCLLLANAQVQRIFSNTACILSDVLPALGTFNWCGGVRVDAACWCCSNFVFSEAELVTGSSSSWKWQWYRIRMIC